MANVQRAVGQNLYSVEMPVAANVKVEVGDLIYKAANSVNAVPASGVTWDTSADKTSALNRLSFIGVSQSQHLDTEAASTILVATEGYFRFPSSGVSAATGVGVTYGPVKDAGGNYLANQLLAVASTSGAICKLVNAIPTGMGNNGSLKVRMFGTTSAESL